MDMLKPSQVSDAVWPQFTSRVSSARMRILCFRWSRVTQDTTIDITALGQKGAQQHTANCLGTSSTNLPRPPRSCTTQRRSTSQRYNRTPTCPRERSQERTATTACLFRFDLDKSKKGLILAQRWKQELLEVQWSDMAFGDITKTFRV